MQMSVSGYAKHIGVSRWTVYRMIESKKLPKGVRAKNIAGRIVIEFKDPNRSHQ